MHWDDSNCLISGIGRFKHLNKFTLCFSSEYLLNTNTVSGLGTQRVSWSVFISLLLSWLLFFLLFSYSWSWFIKLPNWSWAHGYPARHYIFFHPSLKCGVWLRISDVRSDTCIIKTIPLTQESLFFLPAGWKSVQTVTQPQPEVKTIF